jgi:hypothetical protein
VLGTLIVIHIAGLLLGCGVLAAAVVADGLRADGVPIRLGYTGLVLMVAGALGAVAVGQVHPERPVLARWSLLLLLAATICWLVVLWITPPPVRRSWGPAIHLCISLSVVGTGLTVVGHILVSPAPSTFWVVSRWLHAVGLAMMMPVSIVLIWMDWWHPWAEPVLSITILWSLGTLVSAAISMQLARRIARRRSTASESVSSSARLQLTCPACGAEQTLPSGLVRCSSCRFSLRIELGEPRCECGYLLYRLAGATCPECGRAVPANLRPAEYDPAPPRDRPSDTGE